MIVVVEGDLGKISERPMRGSRWRRLASGWLNVAGRQIRLVWFNLPAYMRGYLPGGERVLVRGRVATATDGGIEIVQPELHRLSDGEPKGIRPVYRLPPIVGQRLFASLVTRTLAEASDSIRGAVPEELRDEIPLGARGAYDIFTIRRPTLTSRRWQTESRAAIRRSPSMNSSHSSSRFRLNASAVHAGSDLRSMARRA